MGETSAIETSVAYSFSETLEFAVTIETDEIVQEVILFYGQERLPLVRRVYPPFVPGKRVAITYTESLEPGQFAPGTTFRYWWRFVLASGETLESPVETFMYEDATHPWETLSSDRIDLYYYDLRKSQIQDILAEGEQILSRIAEEFGIHPTQRIRIYVYPNERDMQRAIAPRSSGYDARITTLGMVVAEDTLLLLGSHPQITRNMAHELCHVVVGMVTENPYAGLPRWLDEGLAMYIEGDLPLSNALALERAVERDVLPSVRSMTSYSGRAEDVNLFYGASYSVVSFLLESYGKEKLLQLLETFSQGTRQEEALQRVYGFSLHELDSLWRASLGLPPRELPESIKAFTPRFSAIIL